MKKTKFSEKQYIFLIDGLTRTIEQTPKLKPERDHWDIEGNWDDCGDIHFIDSRYMSEFATWRDFGCRTIKLVNYGQPAVRIVFSSKHKYWLKKPNDLTEEERETYISEYLNGLLMTSIQLQDQLMVIPPMAQAEIRNRLNTLKEEIEGWKQILGQSGKYELAVSTYQRGYAYLYINYKFIKSSGEYDNASEHLLHHTRDRLGSITQRKQNIVFVNTDEINRAHPYQHKEIENYLNRFLMKSNSGPKWLYARIRPEIQAQESFGLHKPGNDSGQLDLF